MALESVGEPSLTPPPEARTTECRECGDVLRGEDAFVLQDLDYCGPCAARRAVDILDPAGSLHVTRSDIERAALVLSMWAGEAREERLKGFAGRRS